MEPARVEAAVPLVRRAAGPGPCHQGRPSPSCRAMKKKLMLPLLAGYREQQPLSGAALGEQRARGQATVLVLPEGPAGLRRPPAWSTARHGAAAGGHGLRESAVQRQPKGRRRR